MPDTYTEWKTLKNNLQKKTIILKKAQHQNVGIIYLSSIGQDFFSV